MSVWLPGRPFGHAIISAADAKRAKDYNRQVSEARGFTGAGRHFELTHLGEIALACWFDCQGIDYKWDRKPEGRRSDGYDFELSGNYRVHVRTATASWHRSLIIPWASFQNLNTDLYAAMRFESEAKVSLLGFYFRRGLLDRGDSLRRDPGDGKMPEVQRPGMVVPFVQADIQSPDQLLRILADV
jgi:hypothetical protein